jgi:hypothetical protein
VLVNSVAAVEASDTSTLVPEVSLDKVDTHQPLGFSNVTLVRLEHHSNVKEPMLVTPLPIVTLTRLMHS